MLMKIGVSTNQNAQRSDVRLRLDWQTMKWTLADDPRTVWKRISFEKGGRFERKDWGVIWIWDNARNPLILHKAPSSGRDFCCPAAEGRLYDPVDESLRDGTVAWSIDLAATLAAPPAPAAAPAPKLLSAFRLHLLQQLKQLLPAPYLSANCDVLTSKMRRSDPAIAGATGNYTSCGSMPGFVTSEMGKFKGLKGKAHENYMKTYSLNGTNIIRIKGLRYNCWRINDLVERPIPGDIYGLLVPKATDKEKALFSHVGVIEDCSGNPWKTMDLGQGTGFDGKRVDRDYKADVGELYGETNQGGGYRVLAGWVNVDDYLKLG